MLKRLSVVDSVDINDIAFSSVFNVGDSERILPFSRALAVQREAQLFYGNEGNLNDYPIFTQSIPLPVITENVRMTQINASPTINVNSVRILGMSFSSVFQIGSANSIEGEARVKHIRQLLKNKHFN